jgi:hypothetical protein
MEQKIIERKHKSRIFIEHQKPIELLMTGISTTVNILQKKMFKTSKNKSLYSLLAIINFIQLEKVKMQRKYILRRKSCNM